MRARAERYGQVMPPDRGVADAAGVAEMADLRGPVRLYSPRPHVQAALDLILGTDRDNGVVPADHLPGVLERVLESLSATEAAEVMVVHDKDGPVWIETAMSARHRLKTGWLPPLLAGPELDIWFQPIVDVANVRIVGREALVRATALGRLRSGREIVEAAAAHGLLFALDQRARTEAIRHAAPLLKPGEMLYLNLSPSAVDDPELCLAPTWAAAREAGLDIERLCLELVSADSSPDRELLRRLRNHCRDMGALVVLDDLGAGGASMHALRELRPDLVKLDRTLLLGLSYDASRQRLVSAMIDFAHELGIRVVAHGIEDEDDLSAIASLGADSVEGFLLGQPAAWMDSLSMWAQEALSRLR